MRYREIVESQSEIDRNAAKTKRMRSANDSLSSARRKQNVAFKKYNDKLKAGKDMASAKDQYDLSLRATRAQMQNAKDRLSVT